jgi:dTDP-4-dehydrorhamnose 3,5-epimerase
MYLCSATYDPVREHAINPLDPELGLALALPEGVIPVLSPKDAAAPSLREAAALGLLPRYDECLRYYAKLTSGA